MDARLIALYDIFKLNSRIYLNCLDAMDDDQSAWRPSEDTNSVGHIALHLVDARFHMAKVCGLGVANPLEGRLKAKDIPSLDDIRSAWKLVTGELRQKFGQIGEADLAKDTGSKLPLEDKSLLSVLAFLLQHDSYHIGQLALLRKQVGLPAMSYQ